MNFDIDKLRCSEQPPYVSKPADANEPQREACCSSPPRLRGKDLAAFASLFKALGDETRLGIVASLLARGDCLCACEIEAQVKDLSQPTISHHLRLLREAGLVLAERRGTWVYYTLNPAARERLAHFVSLLEG